MHDNVVQEKILKRLRTIEHELEELKRDIYHNLQEKTTGKKNSLFGSVQSDEITDEMIEDSKKSLFRNLNDI